MTKEIVTSLERSLNKKFSKGKWGEKYLGYRYRGVSNKNMTQKDDEQEQLEELLGGNAALLQIICSPDDNTGQLVFFNSFTFGRSYNPLRHLTTGNRGAVHNLPCLDRRPLVTLHPHAQCEKTGTEGKRLETHLLTVIHLGFSSPVEELDHVLGHLGGGGRGAILVLDKTVKEDTGHTNSYDMLEQSESAQEIRDAPVPGK